MVTVGKFWDFMIIYKKFWLPPIVVAMVTLLAVTILVAIATVYYPPLPFMSG